MKGVLICGGTGSRLRPLTKVFNKSLLPVYDKALIQYPLEVFLKAGITEIAIITGTEHMDQVQKFLASGEEFGCSFTFMVQEKPGGIAQALGLAEKFAEGDSVCAILGDNIFFDDLSPVLKAFTGGAHVFLKEVPDPERFGVAEMDANGTVLSIEEKPQKPKSNYCVTGCYLYDEHCFEMIRNQKPSARGELEITDVSKAYLAKGTLKATVLKDDWIDAGTFESLFRAADLVRKRKLT
jgi:glucose-1-phosphate thymidylyltransferase